MRVRSFLSVWDGSRTVHVVFLSLYERQLGRVGNVPRRKGAGIAVDSTLDVFKKNTQERYQFGLPQSVHRS